MFELMEFSSHVPKHIFTQNFGNQHRIIRIFILAIKVISTSPWFSVSSVGYYLYYQFCFCKWGRKAEFKIRIIYLKFKISDNFNMSDLTWAVKNGDLDQVKDIVDKKVWSIFERYSFKEWNICFRDMKCFRVLM